MPIFFVLLLMLTMKSYAMLEEASAEDVHKFEQSRDVLQRHNVLQTQRAGEKTSTQEAQLPERDEELEAALAKFKKDNNYLKEIKSRFKEECEAEFAARQQYAAYVIANFEKYGIDVRKLQLLQSKVLQKMEPYLQAEYEANFLETVSFEIAWFKKQANEEAQQIARSLQEQYPTLDADLLLGRARLKNAEEQLSMANQEHRNYLKKNVKNFFQKRFAYYQKFQYMDVTIIAGARKKEFELLEKHFEQLLKTMPRNSGRWSTLYQAVPKIKSVFDSETKIYLDNVRYYKLKLDLPATRDSKERNALKAQIEAMEKTIEQDKKEYFQASSNLAKTAAKSVRSSSTAPVLRDIIVYGGITLGVLFIVGFVIGAAVVSTEKSVPSENTNPVPSMQPQ